MHTAAVDNMYVCALYCTVVVVVIMAVVAGFCWNDNQLTISTYYLLVQHIYYVLPLVHHLFSCGKRSTSHQTNRTSHITPHTCDWDALLSTQKICLLETNHTCKYAANVQRVARLFGTKKFVYTTSGPRQSVQQCCC